MIEGNKMLELRKKRENRSYADKWRDAIRVLRVHKEVERRMKNNKEIERIGA